MTITVEHLTRRFGRRVVLDDISFTVQPGVITGFLGRNGAGKTTTMRAILGLDSRCSGRALIRGRRYAEFGRPLCEVGALLDAGVAHPGRSAHAHLAWLAAASRVSGRRVPEVLAETGLADVAGQRVRTFSLGMRQRLALAAALLGDPHVLILDEPFNGLDTQGVQWLRTTLRTQADRGDTVLIASHQFGELAGLADHLLILDAGRLVADVPVGEVATHTLTATDMQDLYLRFVAGQRS